MLKTVDRAADDPDACHLGCCVGSAAIGWPLIQGLIF